MITVHVSISTSEFDIYLLLQYDTIHGRWKGSLEVTYAVSYFNFIPQLFSFRSTVMI